MKPYSVFLSVVLVVCIGLVAACKRPESSLTKSSDKSSSKAVQSASADEKKTAAREQPAEKKLAAYGGIYNVLVNEEHGLPEAYRTLTKKVLKAKVSDNIVFPAVENLDTMVTSLRQSRAEAAGGLEALDSAADKLIEACEKLLAHEKELVPYFADKAYKDDNMARAKTAFSSLEKDYESALAALSKFGAEMLTAKRAVAEKHMETFKAEGDMVRYHTEEILMLSEELLALFDDPRVPFNRSEAFSRGNSIIVKLDNAIRAQRKAVEDARAKEKDDKVSPYYDAIRNSAGGIISDYREVRDKRSQVAFDGMLKKYDKAVQDYNSAQMKG
ncbi:YiiG family protein [Oxalobacter sp. OttesenSCG-928-P03]|nr:YiiG family protein [Oxalobacter sp. OttesenSCG-928-P03]